MVCIRFLTYLFNYLLTYLFTFLTACNMSNRHPITIVAIINSFTFYVQIKIMSFKITRIKTQFLA